MNEIQQLLLSDMPLLISRSGYMQLMMCAFPSLKNIVATKGDVTEPLRLSLFGFDDVSYAEKTAKSLAVIKKSIAQDPSTKDLNVTCDYSSPDLPDDSIAYHRIFGLITANSSYRFSTKQLESDILAAEANPQITSHFLHVNSPGGDAWYLDRLGETMSKCEKPIIALYEQCCSAAYHIACHAQRVYANTKFDFVGCIGTMVSFWDFEDYYKSLGLKLVEAKATNSDLKNKMVDDLIDGKPKQFVENVLNSLNEAFLSTVRTQRKQLADLATDHPALRGETYYTDGAIQVGLADGCRTFSEAISECATLGQEYSKTLKAKNFVYNSI